MLWRPPVGSNNWLIISFSQLNFNGPRLTVYKDLCLSTLLPCQSITAMLPCEFSKHDCGKCTLQQQQHESIFKSLAEARFKWAAAQHSEKSILKASGCMSNSEPWHGSSPYLFSKEFMLCCPQPLTRR